MYCITLSMYLNASQISMYLDMYYLNVSQYPIVSQCISMYLRVLYLDVSLFDAINVWLYLFIVALVALVALLLYQCIPYQFSVLSSQFSVSQFKLQSQAASSQSSLRQSRSLRIPAVRYKMNTVFSILYSAHCSLLTAHCQTCCCLLTCGPAHTAHCSLFSLLHCFHCSLLSLLTASLLTATSHHPHCSLYINNC